MVNNKASTDGKNKICISCSGSGKIECDCANLSDGTNCFTCNGEGEFICPICEGSGLF